MFAKYEFGGGGVGENEDMKHVNSKHSTGPKLFKGFWMIFMRMLQQTSINVLLAIRLTYKSWQNFTETTIAWCSGKAGFVISPIEEEDRDNEFIEEGVDNLAENLWIKLTAKCTDATDVPMDDFFHG